jgi:putative transposase
MGDSRCDRHGMPWAQTDHVQQRILFVQEARRKRLSFAALCQLFGISRKTGYKWLQRASSHGEAALVDQSRRPNSNPMAVPSSTIERLVELREEHPSWGARKLLAWLDEREPWWLLPAASTVTAHLKQRGLVKTRQRQRRMPPRRPPFADVTEPNDVWCADYKGEFLVGDGARCFPLTVTDAFSRMGLCCRGLDNRRTPSTRRALELTFRQWGLPRRFRTDNGSPFGTKCRGPLSRLSVWLLKLGVDPEYIEPGHPGQNGRHERFHLTLKQETCFPPAASLRAQQRRFDVFRREYNYDRPHEALGQIPPARVYTASTRPFPNRVVEPEYPLNFERRRVISRGQLCWRGNVYFISEALENETIGLIEVDVGSWEIYFGPRLLGRLHDRTPDLGVIRPRKVLPMSPV